MYENRNVKGLQYVSWLCIELQEKSSTQYIIVNTSTVINETKQRLYFLQIDIIKLDGPQFSLYEGDREPQDTE